MPTVRNIDYAKKGRFSKISYYIREKIDTIGAEYVKPSPLISKYPQDVIFDLNNNKTTVAGYNQNPWGNFENKTTGLDSSLQGSL